MKPQARAYATQSWAQRRAFNLPADPVAAQQAAFDCNRTACAPLGDVRPAIAAWWTRRRPSPERLADLCEGAEILILRAAITPPPQCESVIVLRRADFEAGGAAEIYPAPGGWRFVWAQTARGRRPWALTDTVE
jgi:competence protein ComEC